VTHLEGRRAIRAGPVRRHDLRQHHPAAPPRTARDEAVLRWVTRPYYELEEEQVHAQARRQQAISELVPPQRAGEVGAISVRDAVRRPTGLDRM
jgi:hypothetical protein